MKRLIRSDSLIFGMPINKKAVEQTLMSPSGPLMQHLVKLYLYPKNHYRNHWIDEIYAFINEVPTLKHNKKFPDVKFILNNTYYVWEDSIDMKVNKIASKYPESHHYDSKEFHRKAWTYFASLAAILHEFGSVNRDEVESMLLDAGF